MEETGPLRGVLVASDRVRNKELLQVSARDIVSIFELAETGEDDDAISITYDDKRKDYTLRLAKREASRG
jgi:hypothetical protein